MFCDGKITVEKLSVKISFVLKKKHTLNISNSENLFFVPFCLLDVVLSLVSC